MQTGRSEALGLYRVSIDAIHAVIDGAVERPLLCRAVFDKLIPIESPLYYHFLNN